MLIVRPIAKIMVLLSLLLASGIGSFSQEDVVQKIERDVATLGSFEQLIVINLAEKEIVRQLETMIALPTFKADGPTLMLKVASVSYFGLSLISEKPFPRLAALYKQRSETYSDVVKGKMKFAEMGAWERENERQKAVYLNTEMDRLKRSETALDEGRMRTLIEAGTRFGKDLTAAAKIVSTSQ